MYAFRVALPDYDYEWSFVDDAVRRKASPVGSDGVRLLNDAVHVALNREDCDLRVNALYDLVRDSFRSRERGSEMHVLVVLFLPLRAESWKNLLLQRLLHYRKAIDRDASTARVCRRLRQTTACRK